MPKPLSRTWTKRKTPWVAAWPCLQAACSLLPLGEVKTVASVSSFGVLLVFTSVQVAMIALRLCAPNKRRPFRVPFAVGNVPILPVIGIVITLALITQFEPIVYAVSGGAILFGVLVFVIQRRVTA